MGDEGERKPSEPQFLEVSCKSSGQVRRFAAGTEAGFALYLINRKLGIGDPLALYIEAAKEGEEPVSFGPSAVLVNYGKDWKLQTVTEKGHEEAKYRQHIPKRYPNVTSDEKPTSSSSSAISMQFIGRILVAFVFMFVLGGTLTLFLENLPTLISFVSASL